jgi:predicted nucleic acid-binding protein
MPHFLDTNILLYSISRDPAESGKAKRAVALLDDDRGALSVQVFQEFYVQATRASRTGALTHEQAVGFIQSWSRFRIQEMTVQVLNDALRVREKYDFSLWDSLIIAAALSLGCERLYTEDLAHGRAVEGLTITNPFRA